MVTLSRWGRTPIIKPKEWRPASTQDLSNKVAEILAAQNANQDLSVMENGSIAGAPYFLFSSQRGQTSDGMYRENEGKKPNEPGNIAEVLRINIPHLTVSYDPHEEGKAIYIGSASYATSQAKLTATFHLAYLDKILQEIAGDACDHFGKKMAKFHRLTEDSENRKIIIHFDALQRSPKKRLPNNPEKVVEYWSQGNFPLTIGEGPTNSRPGEYAYKASIPLFGKPFPLTFEIAYANLLTGKTPHR